MKSFIRLSVAAVALFALTSSPASAAYVDVDVSTWQTWGGLQLHPSTNGNSETIISIGPNTEVTGVEFLDLSFEALGPSWQSEVVLSIETPDGSTYWDWRPATGFDTPGAFGPVSGAFGVGPGSVVWDGTPVFASASGDLRVSVYDTFDDAGQDAQFLSGVIRVHYVPEPSALALLGLASVGLVARRRRS